MSCTTSSSIIFCAAACPPEKVRRLALRGLRGAGIDEKTIT